MIRKLSNESWGEFVPTESVPLRAESASAIDSVNTARRILEVVPGERRLLPEFGCRVHCIESFATSHERAVGAAFVEDGLHRWAPQLGIRRAKIEGVSGEWVHISLVLTAGTSSFRIRHRRDKESELTSEKRVASRMGGSFG